jgi:hypothetical protein
LVVAVIVVVVVDRLFRREKVSLCEMLIVVVACFCFCWLLL